MQAGDPRMLFNLKPKAVDRICEGLVGLCRRLAHRGCSNSPRFEQVVQPGFFIVMQCSVLYGTGVAIQMSV